MDPPVSATLLEPRRRLVMTSVRAEITWGGRARFLALQDEFVLWDPEGRIVHGREFWERARRAERRLARAERSKKP